jgi:PKD repeat protein
VVGNPAGNQAPTVQIAASKTSGKAPLSVQFTAAGSDPDGDQLSYVWEFGDGGAAGGTKATHVYKSAGSYTAKVTATDGGGKSASATVVITVTAGAGANGAPVPPAGGPTIAALAGSGVNLAVGCEATGTAKLKLRLTRKAARKLGLSSRRIAVKSVSCTAGKTVTVKVRAGRQARRALKRKAPKSLRVAISVALGGLEYKSAKVRFT